MDIKELSGDLILVKPLLNDNKSSAGVLMTGVKKLSNRGEVIMTGPGTTDRPMKLKAGDNIVFQSGAGIPEIFKQEEHLIMRQSDHLAKY